MLSKETKKEEIKKELMLYATAFGMLVLTIAIISGALITYDKVQDNKLTEENEMLEERIFYALSDKANTDDVIVVKEVLEDGKMFWKKYEVLIKNEEHTIIYKDEDKRLVILDETRDD